MVLPSRGTNIAFVPARKLVTGSAAVRPVLIVEDGPDKGSRVERRDVLLETYRKELQPYARP